MKKRGHSSSLRFFRSAQKRGQLTIFIIIGIVIVVGIIGFFIYQAGANERFFNQPDVAEGVSEIKDYLEECIEYFSEDSLMLVLAQGGYFDAPNRHEIIEYESSTGFIPYYYYERENNVPSLSVVESEIAKAVNDIVGVCVDNSEFTGFDVSFSRASSKVTIKDEEVEIMVDMPVTLKRGGYRMILDMSNYPIIIPSRLKGMHNVANAFVDDISIDAEYCINCIGDLAINEGVSIDIIGLDEISASIILSEDMDGTEEPVYYFFLIKFSPDEQRPIISAWDD